MTQLVVDRLLTHAEVRDSDDEASVRRLVDDVAGGRLEPDLPVLPAAEELWCVRRLDVHVDLDGSLAGLERAWAASVRLALLARLAGRHVTEPGQAVGSDDQVLVGYRRREHAVADVVASLALGRSARAWAWQALGVLVPRDPDPLHQPADAAVTALTRDPERLLAALVLAVSAAGASAVHRLLGNEGWRSMASAVLDAAAVERGPWFAAAPLTAPTPSETLLVEALLRRSTLARAWSSVPPLLDDGGRTAMAALVVAEVEPALLRRASVGLRVALGEKVSVALPTAGLVVRMPRGTDGREQRPAGVAPVAPVVSPEPPPPSSESDDPTESTVLANGSTPVEQEDVPATQWGGLVHLLATASAARIPDDLLEDAVLAGLAPSESLHHLLVMLASEVADDRYADPWRDPAVAALSGRAPGTEPPPRPIAEIRRALRAHARRWRRETASRLGVEDAGRAMELLLPRLGHVSSRPSWTEVRLSLADVDVDVRRAGLDLDPGFVPWLGAVVVIRYV